MKRLAMGLAAALAVAACGGGASTGQPAATTSAPTSTPAPTATQATTVAFKAELKSSEEVPPIAGPEASCNGTADITLDRTANSAKFDVEIKGCPDSTTITLAHIHRGAKGANGGVVVNTGLTAGEVRLTGGGGKFSKTVATVDAALVQEIIANPANFYFNVHSQANAPGVIRGQLERK